MSSARFVEPRSKGWRKNSLFPNRLTSVRVSHVELQRELEEIHNVSLHTVSAQLPTITPVGMASLMPQADKKLSLVDHGDSILPALDGEPTRNTTERAEWIRSIYGDRYMDILLQDIVKKEPKRKSRQL